MVERIAAPTSAAAVEVRMWPWSVASVVIATTSGSWVEANSASDGPVAQRQVAVERHRRHAADDQEQAEEDRQQDQPAGGLSSASRLNFTPLTTKKKGMKKP